MGSAVLSVHFISQRERYYLSWEHEQLALANVYEMYVSNDMRIQKELSRERAVEGEDGDNNRL